MKLTVLPVSWIFAWIFDDVSETFSVGRTSAYGKPRQTPLSYFSISSCKKVADVAVDHKSWQA